ncbi:hypothetical protein [Vallitalea guaymasensis]|uniref:Uncharacterized protein n=1 Tax=Vallitalea guaymasensis TaxID=1185412 RepID=A0A8J8M8B3_9FIRM|nr:hypothetical protein [Vallitalea guaymasensis]QUH28040.1 hypothetical protein HYG85_03560 [Vallitalea guaymasensis]
MNRLEIQNITKTYGEKNANDNINITLENGVYGLLGPNDTFKVMKQPMTNNDIEAIIIALKGLETTLENEQITKTLKINPCHPIIMRL